MTMNKKNVRQALLKLLAGFVLVLVLAGASVPAAFAAGEQSSEQSSEQTTEQVTGQESTEAETAAPGQEEGKPDLSEDEIKALADVLGANDLARQLFLAACGYNSLGENGTGVYLKYTYGDGKYLNEKGEFIFDPKVSVDEAFTETESWDRLYAKQILIDAINSSKAQVAVPGDDEFSFADAQAIVAAMQTEVDLEDNGNIIDAILRAVGYVLGLMTKYLTFGTNNYILSLLYFGIVVELLMIPMAISQQKNMIKQAKLRPKEMAIRKRYAGRNDQATMQKVNQEIQELYQKENTSPFSGCLPLLIQLPIMIALYQVVIDPAFYVLGQAKAFSGAIAQYFTTSAAAGGFGGVLNSDRGTIEILSKLRENGIEAFESLKDFAYFSNSGALYDALHGIEEAGGIPSVNIGSWNFGLTPWSAVTTGGGFFASHWWLLLVPVLTFVVYFGSMKINRKLSYQPTTAANDKAAGCSNNMMDIMMPMMSVYIAFIVPAAIGVYWMFKSVLGTVKQLIMKKVMPLPVFTEEDYKAAEKELYGKHPPKAPKSSGTKNPNVRSLHHIDDDEYDSKGNYIGRPESTEDESETADHKNTKAPAMAEPLKDESDKHEQDDASDDKNS